MPPRKTADVVIQFLFVGMKDMGAVLLDPKTVAVRIIEHIATDVVPALPDQNAIAGFRKLAGNHRTGQPAAYN